jgi:hypothetical protein
VPLSIALLFLVEHGECPYEEKDGHLFLLAVEVAVEVMETVTDDCLYDLALKTLIPLVTEDNNQIDNYEGYNWSKV